MAFIRTVIGFLSVFMFTIIFLPFAIIFGLFRIVGLKRLSATAMHKLLQGAAKFIIFIIGCKLIIKDHDKIPVKCKDGLCFACNHTGIFDIVILFASVGVPFGFITKKEILLVPMINVWVWILGGIFLDRKNPRKALVTIKKCTKKLKNGVSMAVFPEGTRSKGRGILPFKSGPFKMAIDSDSTIIPVAITGGYDVFEKTGLIQSSIVYVSFGDPIQTKTFTDEHKRQAICDRTQATITEMLKYHNT
ncbi:MAG: 1-acyl-sn-glycerol-3-phosphate acyltransferase [Spirochaetaceae bacterium]|jgi:1-acyl-sn-glycerol-3-phosphate acyltransferase|nr:1-acyl-sn-glycerol-3-phosphate acyltransferase [Spirochaetaceae bacterium]